MNSDLVLLILYLAIGTVILIIIGTLFTTGVYTIARKIALWFKRKK